MEVNGGTSTRSQRNRQSTSRTTTTVPSYTGRQVGNQGSNPPSGGGFQTPPTSNNPGAPTQSTILPQSNIHQPQPQYDYPRQPNNPHTNIPAPSNPTNRGLRIPNSVRYAGQSGYGAANMALPMVQYQGADISASRPVNPTAGIDMTRDTNQNDTWGGQFWPVTPAGPSALGAAYNPDWDFSKGYPVQKTKGTGVSWLDAFQTANTQEGGAYNGDYFSRVYGTGDAAHQYGGGAQNNALPGSLNRPVTANQQALVNYTRTQANRQSWLDAWNAALYPYQRQGNEPWTGYIGPGGKQPGTRAASPDTTTPGNGGGGGGGDTGNGGNDYPASYDGGGYGGGGGGGGDRQAAPWFYGLVSWRF